MQICRHCQDKLSDQKQKNCDVVSENYLQAHFLDFKDNFMFYSIFLMFLWFLAETFRDCISVPKLNRMLFHFILKNVFFTFKLLSISHKNCYNLSFVQKAQSREF